MTKAIGQNALNLCRQRGGKIPRILDLDARRLWAVTLTFGLFISSWLSLTWRYCSSRDKSAPLYRHWDCTSRTAHRESRGIALLFLNHGTRRGWGVNITPRPLFTPGKDPVPILQEAGWAPEPVWTGRKFHPHRDSIPDCLARSSVAISTELPGSQFVTRTVRNYNKCSDCISRRSVPIYSTIQPCVSPPPYGDSQSLYRLRYPAHSSRDSVRVTSDWAIVIDRKFLCMLKKKEWRAVNQ